MQVQQILNRLQTFKSFVYKHVRFIETSETRGIEARSALAPTVGLAVRSVRPATAMKR